MEGYWYISYFILADLVHAQLRVILLYCCLSLGMTFACIARTPPSFYIHITLGIVLWESLPKIYHSHLASGQHWTRVCIGIAITVLFYIAGVVALYLWLIQRMHSTKREEVVVSALV